jgi:cytidylate kinase
MHRAVITIDGPTASGKGTVAALVAEALGWAMLDSGALYRLVALQALRSGINPDEQARLAEIAGRLPVQFLQGEIFLSGERVTNAIRSEAVGNLASQVAALPAVRAALLEAQRRYASDQSLVADGRDMGTVVFPDAPLKVFLTASPETRADRRTKQLIDKGFDATISGSPASSLRERVLQDILARDARDMGRAHAPLRPAPDALVIDSSNLSVAQVVEQILQRWASLSP